MSGSTEEQQFTERTPDFVQAEIHHVGGGEVKPAPEPQRIVEPSLEKVARPN
jgi:hypothetical protein